MPLEQEMVPKDKYTIFDRKEKKYRKGIHSEFTGANIGGNDMLILLQSYRSGQDCPRESTLQDTEREIVGYMYHTGVEVCMEGVMESNYIRTIKDLQ